MAADPSMRALFELNALITERSGMEAENKAREARGAALAYVDSDFFALADRIRQVGTAVYGPLPDAADRGN